MSTLPTWTIAIPTYNGEAFLEKTLQSVMTQTSQAFELIVCDDCSTDESVSIVKRLCGHRVVLHLNESGTNLGLAGNWNRCVELASGEWITILHQDDLLLPGFIEKHRSVAGESGEIGMITGPADLVDADGNTISALENRDDMKWPDTDYIIWQWHEMADVLVKCNPLRCPATSFRRDLHQKIGGFDVKWKYVVDWDFWYRLSQVANVAMLNEKLAFQRWHEASETQRLAQGTIDLEENEAIMYRILDDNFYRKDDRVVNERAILRRLALAWLARATQAAAAGNRRLELKLLRKAFQCDSSMTMKALADSPKTLAMLMLGISWRRRFH